jgi:phosphopantetheine adenylyltransferase
MKNFKQLIRELPSNKVVAAFGQFQPPTAGHEHLVKAVQSIANNGDHVIYASANEDKKLNPLPADRKVYFLQRMFAEGNFKSSEGITSIVEMASELSKKYKHLTVVTFADKVGEYEQQLKEHNGTMYQFDTIKVISAGDVDPDSNTVSVVSNVKMCESAKTGNFTQFKKGVPHTLTELDSRRLMNDLRKGMGLDPIRENVIFERTKIREQYVAGKIFNVGDRVKDEDGVYEIMDRGANYITVVNESGNLMKKWIDKVSPSRKKIEENLDANPNEISFKNYTTTNFHKDPKVFHAFKGTISKWEQGGIEDGVAVLNAIKHTDSYLSMVDGKDRKSEENKAKQALNRIGEYQSHNYWDDHKVITTDDVMAKHNADLQDAIAKVNVKEESEVMDSKKIAMRYKEFMKKSGSKEKAVDIAEPSSGKPMTVLKNDGKLKRQIPGHVGSYDTDVTEAYQKKTAYQKLNTRMKTVTGKSLDDRSREMDKIKQDTLDRIAQYKKDGIIKNEHIEKVAGGYEVESEHGNKNLGKSKTLAGAKKRLKQVEYFKHMGEETELEEAAPFKTKEDAVKYAKDKVKTHRDKLDGIEIHSHSGGFDVNHTSNSSGRNSLQKIGAKHLGTIYKEDVDLEEAKQIDELSTDLLGKYKAAAGKNAKAADESGNYKKGDKRFAGINKATRKQFDNDLKKHGQYVKEGRGLADKYYALAQDRKATADENKDNHETYHTHMADHHDHMSRYHEELGQHRSAQTHADKADMHHEKSMERQKNKTAVKEDVYSSDTKTKKVQVQDKDGNWVFKDRKFHPKRINFAASKMNGKPAQADDPTKLDTETAYQKHLDKMEKQRNEAWVLNPDGKTKKKYKDIKDNKTLSISNTAPFDAFSNTNNQT